MVLFLALILILGGTLAILAGLLLIAPEVRVYQIDVTSRGSWMFRIGALVVVPGLVALRIADGTPRSFRSHGQNLYTSFRPN